jgi:uncharacterized surface protein with fasciclin (FAS1) repeats
MEKNKKSLPLIAIIVITIAFSGLIVYVVSQNSKDTSESIEQESRADYSENIEQNIIDTASSYDSLTTFVTAVAAADLVDTLNGVGPYTVLAPTNDAFSALPAGTLESLLLPENQPQLSNILTYHVISGSILSTDLTNGQIVETVSGKSLTVEITDDGVFFVDANGGRAKVSTADLEASNGVLHIIDAVLLP